MRRSRRTLSVPFYPSALILLIVIISSLCFAAPADRIMGPIALSRTMALAKSHHPMAQRQYDQGLVDPSFKLNYVTLIVAPSPTQQTALNQLLADQQDPRSPLYHQWLNPQQFADRFGLSENDLAKVSSWLTSEGFRILSVGGGRNTVIFSGTASQAQHAFGTEIHSYLVDGAERFANSTPVMIPAALDGIVASVMGLHNFRAQPANRPQHVGALRPAHSNYYDGNYILPPPNFLAPGDIATIYDLNRLYAEVDGANQTLAIVGQTDVYLADLNDFRSGFSLTPISTSDCTTNGDGVIIPPCTDPLFSYVLNGTDAGVSAGDLGEADLDLEWAGATAPSAQIIYVNSGGTSNGVYDALTAVINPPTGPPLSKVVSMSYGYCEQFFTGSLEPVLQEGNAEGVTIVNSSGDASSAACDYNPPGTTNTYNPPPPFAGAQYGLGVSYPASSPEVTGVGGTEISLANDSYPSQSSYWSTTLGLNGGTAVSYIPEIQWNDDQEYADYCHAPASGDPFCEYGDSQHVSGWVPLTTTATAQQVQSDVWLDGAGGGASNCWYENSDNVCLGAGPGPTTGGGFAQPLYQQGLSVPGAPAGVRYVPDISLLASPDFPGHIWCTPLSELSEGGSTSSCANGIYDAVNTYFSIVGGTSASAPIFAGIVTLLNQYVVKEGLQASPGLGNINPTLYRLAISNPSAFNQVTSGNNMAYCQPGTPTGFPSTVVCPAAVSPSTQGVFGYSASNADAKTGYNLVTGLGSIDAYNLAGAFAAVGSTTSTAVTSSLNPSNFGVAVTFTATVTTTGANAPTGTVTFYAGSTSLGTGTLANVSGLQETTLTTSTLSPPTQAITASYGGDSNNAPSTSPVLTQTIVAPAFSLSTPTTPAPVLAGGFTTSTFTVTPTGGATKFAGNVTFACNGLQNVTGVTCSFNTGQTNSSQIAAGSGATLVTLTINTAGPNANTQGGMRRRADNRSPRFPLTLPLAGIVMLGFAGRKMSKHSAIAGLCVSLALLGLLIACGGGGNSTPPVAVSVSPGTPASIYPNYTADNWPSQTSTFTATVSNSTNTAVTWTASIGTIASTGNAMATYTAPTVAQGLAGSATITATAAADSTKSATATETISPATVPTAIVGAPYNITVTATESTTQNNTAAIALTVN